MTDLVRDHLAAEPDFVGEFEDRLGRRQLVKSLAVIRARAGLTQQDLATRMGCSQSKISKFENGDDSAVQFGDVEAYLRATAHAAKIILVPGGGTLVDDVKMHALQIKHLLDRMVALAGRDGATTNGVAAFIEEAARNLLRFTKMAGDVLPPGTPESNRPVHVETPEPEDAGLPAAV